MAKELKTQYQEFVRGTAPDMDMLWSRIENRIDKKEALDETSYEQNRTKIKASGFNFKGITAAAAAIVVIVSAAVIFSQRNGFSTNDAATPETFTMDTNDEKAELTQDAADNGGEMDFTNGAIAGEASPDTDDLGAGAEDAAEYEAADEDTFLPEYAYDEAEGEDADTDTEMIKTNKLNNNQSDTANKPDKSKTADYGSLALADTDTPPFMESYASADNNGDEPTVEQIFDETQFFAVARVADVKLGESSAEYTLEIDTVYLKATMRTEPREITLTTASPYILRENREYILPFKNPDGEWTLVYEDIPQIEITLDGGIIYPKLWGQLSDDEKKLSGDIYPNMMYADNSALGRLLEMWRNS